MRSVEVESSLGTAAMVEPCADQRRIRPTPPVRDVSEVIAFLAELEEVFGPTVKPRRIDDGDRFLL